MVERKVAAGALGSESQQHCAKSKRDGASLINTSRQRVDNFGKKKDRLLPETLHNSQHPPSLGKARRIMELYKHRLGTLLASRAKWEKKDPGLHDASSLFVLVTLMSCDVTVSLGRSAMFSEKTLTDERASRK
ncbi:hypothetical protein C0Q70_00782 [Pomacea canaliculata]|uniref:Uncharacterized protein n=1 Tax=Pomacea canaliculata TaxID=400727 RepID=A0A2T7PXL2_POMCA|nr:hypothetical protein C0Q70_00782 [Pomacea canaliculata]